MIGDPQDYKKGSNQATQMFTSLYNFAGHHFLKISQTILLWNEPQTSFSTPPVERTDGFAGVEGP